MLPIRAYWTVLPIGRQYQNIKMGKTVTYSGHGGTMGFKIINS